MEKDIHPCPLNHYAVCVRGICINGVLYYQAERTDGTAMIVCFDVRS